MSLILVVDDEPDMRLALSTVLKKEGHQIVEAEDGETALEELTKKPFELILLDIRLPGMDGVQMLKLVRQTRSDMPVIMVTGYGSVDTAVQVMKLGADAYLSKPFRNRELIETVERVLAARHLSRESRVLHRNLADKLSPGRMPEYEYIPKPPPLPWRRIAAAAAASAALGILLGVTYFWAPKIRAYTVPFANPTGLAWDGQSLWATDWLTETVYRLEVEKYGLKVTQKIVLPKSHLTGMAVGNGEVFIADGWRKVIQRREFNSSFNLIAEVPSPGASPSGLFWDGKYLWSCDAASGRIFQHALDPNLTVVGSFPSPGKALVGLFKDEHYLWSADADSRRIYQHRLDATLSVLAQYEIPGSNEGGEPLSAVAFHDGSWWTARDGKAVLLRLSQRSLRRLP